METGNKNGKSAPAIDPFGNDDYFEIKRFDDDDNGNNNAIGDTQCKRLFNIFIRKSQAKRAQDKQQRMWTVKSKRTRVFLELFRSINNWTTKDDAGA